MDHFSLRVFTVYVERETENEKENVDRKCVWHLDKAF